MDSPPTSTPTLIALLRRRAEQQPSRCAYTFLDDGELDARTITYAELDRWARALAGWLATVASPGERALVVMPPGLEYIAAFFGCLYAGLIAVPVPVPHRTRGLPRLISIVRDCRPALALTTGALAAAPPTELGDFPWLAMAQLPHGSEARWQPPRADHSTLAFLQYTSGSTGAPKGVVLSHGNLLANQRTIARAFAHTEDSVIVGWLPPHHDMGLIGNILQPLYLGARCVQMAPQHFLSKPSRWLAAIARYGGTTSGGPNFAYELCASRITAEQKAGLDLSSWTVAFNGAEPVRAATLDRFAAAFTPCGFRRHAFYPCYGLAEATLFVTGGAVDAAPVIRTVERAALERGEARPAPDGLALVGCGQPRGDDRVRIVDPETCRVCADGEIGEIWVAGDSVAHGYWQRPAETAQVFDGCLVSGDGPFLRTGDLGFVDGSHLYVTGRRKDLIIVRGRNLYPEDLEVTAAESHSGLRAGGGAAFAIDRDGEERVVIVHEVGRRAPDELAAFAAAIRIAIAERHEVAIEAIVLIRTGTLPRTTSGKVQRHACRQRFLDGSLDVVWRSAPGERGAIPRTALEATVAAIWSEVLGIEHVGRDDEFLAIGGDSLRAAQVSARLREVAGVEVSAAQMFETTTVAALAAWLEAQPQRGAALDLVAVGRDQPLPLSPVQERLWLVEQLAGGAPIYHLAAALHVTGALDVAALERAVTLIVARHEALRTRFPSPGGQPAQEVVAPAPIALVIRDVAGELAAELRAEARRPFALAASPPVRWTLLRVRDRVHALVLTCHHLVADGWTLRLLLGELLHAYGEIAAGGTPALPAPALQYGDYAVWTRRAEAGEGDLAYWRARLAGATSRLDLPTDRPRPPVQTYAGAREDVVFSPALIDGVSALGRREGVTLFAAIAAGVLALLHRYTGQHDLTIGVPVAGRSRVALEGVAGCFINTLALRVDLSGNPDVSELLARVRVALAEAQAHQGAPFERVIEALALPRTLSHAPLFQVMVAMQPARAPLPPLPGLAVEIERVDPGAAQLDLTLDLIADGATVRGAWEYNTDLFDAATVARMARHLTSLLAGFVATPGAPIAELPMVDEAERRLRAQWNQTEHVYADQRPVHEQIAAQAARTPDAIALIFGERRLTYREVDAAANQVAHLLRRRGVGTDVLVAIAIERSLDLVLGVLGVLKAGGAYVPIDPEYPAERIRFLLEDAGAPVLLTEEAIRGAIEREPTTPPRVRVSDEQLAYTIYTSGSTGHPKGAGNTHRGLRNRLQWMQAQYRLTAADRVLHKTPFSFDVSVWELLWPLMTGATMVIARPGDHRDGERLVELITGHGVTTVHFVPPMLQAFLDTAGVERCRSLRRVISSGEALSAELARRCFERLDAELHNLYGPTEASIDVTAWACTPDDASVPIGRPIANTQIHLLDRHGQPVPVGAAGELYIGGVQLARGYHRRPALTAERFVPDGFGPVPGGRLYRTGDLARYRADGAIELLGRLDHQVKLRGLRIELGEIEARLLAHPAVREAVVVARDEAHGDKRLVAYVTGEAEPAVLAAWLADVLPAYMVPRAICVLDRLPLSPNGKVDRRALPAPIADRPASAAVAPRDELERTIAAVWQEHLPIAGVGVGVDENFFDRGGHSLLLARVAGGLRARLGREIPMLLLFQHPTIGSLAAALRGDVAATAPDLERERARERAGQERRAQLFARRRSRQETTE